MKAQNDVQVTIRVDKNLKESAESLFSKLGMNMSTAFNVFLHKAVNENAIPFVVSVKGHGFGFGYSSGDITNAFTSAVKSEIIEHQQNGLPVARYDKDKKKAYLEFADGVREYVSD